MKREDAVIRVAAAEDAVIRVAAAEDAVIRVAAAEDAGALLGIYAHYVTNTAITFEYTPPPLAAFEERIRGTLKRYPYLVAESGGDILGYAYTGAFRSRAAYGWAAETTIYLRAGAGGAGLGGRLYAALEAVSRAQNILNLNACIASPAAEDAYLTNNSERFHARLGYARVAEFHQCSYKFGTWYNMIWMEKHIGAHGVPPAPVVAFPDLGAEALRALGIRPAAQ